jgi:uncharacterized FAD-dependent dehydrogenase
MPLLLRNITLALEQGEEELQQELCRRFNLPEDAIHSLRIVRKGVDARQRRNIKLVYSVEFAVADEERFFTLHGGNDLLRSPPKLPIEFPQIQSSARIVVVGAGPAGLFAALRLSDHGLTPLLIERGRPVAERVKDVQGFWSRGELSGESNVQFGEGGAGTFSDGKLTTRVRDVNHGYVIDRLIEFGAPPEVALLAKPHIGTDRLRGVVTSLRRYLEGRGVEVRFGHCLTDLQLQEGKLTSVELNGNQQIPCDILILAPGHSARDTYRLLDRRGVALEQKPFAMGVRVEHPQELINRIQYGIPSHPRLPPADYAVTYNDAATGRGAYSFCMCPGGVVIGSASEAGGVVTNGMSSHLRNAPWANSALVVSVGPADFGNSHPLAGVEFQRRWEQAAYQAGGGGFIAPAQSLMSFMGRNGGDRLRSTYSPGVRECDLATTLPEVVTSVLRRGILHFDRLMHGFISPSAMLVGIETRTSAPLRILRGDDCQAVRSAGLYPTGEGAGYAGGIMSAALDGIRVADAVAKRLQHHP